MNKIFQTKFAANDISVFASGVGTSVLAPSISSTFLFIGINFINAFGLHVSDYYPVSAAI